jgi:hypothetical protein
MHFVEQLGQLLYLVDDDRTRLWTDGDALFP